MAGSYAVVLKKSRRNHRLQSLIGTSRLDAINDICKASPILLDQVQSVNEEASKVSVMTKGLRLNGRKYSQGDQVPIYTHSYP